MLVVFNISISSPDGAQRNPGSDFDKKISPDSGAVRLHPGYLLEIVWL
jgi:hypothetical protein